MSATRNMLSAIFLVVCFCFVSMYNVGPASATTTQDCSGDACIILGPAPTNTPLAAAPTVRKAHRLGYLKACEPSYSRGGRKVTIQYGSFKRPSPDGNVTIAAGHCKTFRVHRHTIDWIATEYRTGRFIKEGHVRHIGR